MSLAQTLSALRELILDTAEYPEEPSSREKLLGSRFPSLTTAECQDLASIPPARIKLYTESIFAGKRNLLRAKFPITFALITALAARTGEQVDFYELACALHRWRPWKSSAVPDLAHNFADFIREQRRPWVEAEPLIHEALELECAGMMVARAPNDILTAQQSAAIGSELERSMDWLLEAHGFVPRFVALRKFSLDIVSVFYHYRTHRRLAADRSDMRGPVFSVCGRTAEYVVEWADISEPLLKSVELTPRSQPFPIAALAEEFIKQLPGGKSEAEMAALFVRGVVELNSKGALLLKAGG